MVDKIRIGALISGGGTNLAAILDACSSGAIDAEVVFVGSDRPGARGLERARARDIPAFVVDYKQIRRRVDENPEDVPAPEGFDLTGVLAKQALRSPSADPARLSRFLRSRAVAEAALLEKMSDFGFDLVVLAGFMRTLTPYFIDRVNTDPHRPRIMNIHPALLPAFPGVDGYGDTWRYGCKVGGCTVHFVDYGEDTGPIIGQQAFDILEEDTLESMRAKGLALEWSLYPACIQLYAQGRLVVEEVTHRSTSGAPLRRKRVRILPPPGR